MYAYWSENSFHEKHVNFTYYFLYSQIIDFYNARSDKSKEQLYG
jgi:hypothetical protein